MTPERTADTGWGALAWASGSHVWTHHCQLESPFEKSAPGRARDPQCLGHHSQRQGAGGLIDQEDPKEEESDAQGADHQVPEAPEQRLRPVSGGNQDVGGNGENLQEHEQVEKVPRQDDPLHSEDQEEKEEVESRAVLSLGCRKEHGAEGNQRSHERARPG
jgi:hypothetical protein